MIETLLFARQQTCRIVPATLLVLMCTALPRTAAAQLTVSELELFMPAGTSPTVRTVHVRNESTERIQAVASIEDWERDELGANRFMSAGAHPNSCAAALEVFPTSLALEPGESANLRVSFNAAEVPSANCWSVVFLENRTTQAAGARQLSYTVRTGIKVYGESAGAARDGFVEAMSLLPSSNDSLRVAFRNAGEVQLKVRGTIEVRREDNSVVHRAALENVPVLPGQRRLLTSAIPSLPAGRYVMLALLDFGGTELVAGQMEYEVR